MKARTKKQRFEFKGDIKDDSILIGSHGDADVYMEGNFQLSGMIYCLRYTVTLFIKGEGIIALRGKCNRMVIKRMEGHCTLDLSDLTCKELRCENLRGQSMLVTDKTRVISRANLHDTAELHIAERPLIISSTTAGNSKIVHRALMPTEV